MTDNATRTGLYSTGANFGINIICAGILICLAMAAGAEERIDERMHALTTFDIPAQALSTALKQLANQAGVQILFEERVVAGFAVPTVQSRETILDALRFLLEGTGLEFVTRGETIAVREKIAISTPETARAAESNDHPRNEGSTQRLRIAQALDGARLASPDEMASVDAAHLEQVIVTANKRAERLQDVPASVTAVTGDMLTSIGAARLEDYVAKVPGLVLSNVSFANGSNQLTIRGITTGFGGNPTVGIYIDDSPFGGSTGFGAYQIPDLDPSDLTRVEVLRGPQGTLYGAGSMGGLLKYVTTPPDAGHLSGRVEVNGSLVDGGGSGYGVRGMVNIPLTSTFALRMSGYNREDPGFIDAAGSDTKNNINSARFYGGRVAAAWQVSDHWTARVSAMTQRQKSDGGAVVDHNTLTFRPINGDLQQVRAPGTGYNEMQMGNYDLQITGEFSWAMLSSASSYNKQNIDINLDASARYAPFIFANFGIANGGAAIVSDLELKKFTQEIRLSSPTSSGTWSWLLGMFYTEEDQDVHQYIDTFDGLTGSAYLTPLPSFLIADVPAEFKEIAGFGNLTYRFNDILDITLGLRYSHNKQTQFQTLSGLLTGDVRISGESGDGSLTYLVTPRFHLSDDTMAYLRVASGYRPGGPNYAVVAGVPPSYGPDKVINYEVGLKGEFLERRVSLDFAVFYIDWKDIQLSQQPQGFNYFGNGGAAVSKGIEMAATWRPIAELAISGNASHTVAELSADLPPGSVSAKDGDVLPTTPKWSGQLSAEYEFPIAGEWRGFAGASYRYVGDSAGYFSAPTLPRYQLPSYDVVDFRIGTRGDRVSVTFYAKNLGDSRGEGAAYLSGPMTRVSIIQPRTYGVSISASL